MKIVFDGAFPTLNEHIAGMNANRYGGNDMKQVETERVRLQCLRSEKFDIPVKIKFSWYIKDRRKDPDNIVYAKKFILDGLVKAGIIPNDTQRYIKGFADEWFVDSHERVEVEINPA